MEEILLFIYFFISRGSEGFSVVRDKPNPMEY